MCNVSLLCTDVISASVEPPPVSSVSVFAVFTSTLHIPNTAWHVTATCFDTMWHRTVHVSIQLTRECNCFKTWMNFICHVVSDFKKFKKFLLDTLWHMKFSRVLKQLHQRVSCVDTFTPQKTRIQNSCTSMYSHALPCIPEKPHTTKPTHPLTRPHPHQHIHPLTRPHPPVHC